MAISCKEVNRFENPSRNEKNINIQTTAKNENTKIMDKFLRVGARGWLCI